MRVRAVHFLVAFGLVLFSAGVGQARVKAKDFFPSETQLALAEAAADGRVEKIEQLVQAGADINAHGNEGMTALIWAFMQENKKGYQYLLEHGANPNLQVGRSELTSDGLIDGNSAVTLAAMHEDPWYLEMTLKHGGNPNIVNPVKGMSPVFQCIMLLDHSRPRPRLEQLNMLIAAGADLNARNKNDITPLMYAVRFNRYDMAYLMLQAGADPALKTKWGTTVVYAIKESRTDPESPLYQWRTKVIELLKAKGIDVDSGK
jgi:ankyrin repeat protein